MSPPYAPQSRARACHELKLEIWGTAEQASAVLAQLFEEGIEAKLAAAGGGVVVLNSSWDVEAAVSSPTAADSD